MSVHRVEVSGLPAWVDLLRLLGAGAWQFDADGPRMVARCELDTAAACDLAARLRGLGLDGHPLEVQISPQPKRAATRKARTEDARRRRDGTPGFERRGTRLDAEGRVSLTPERLALRMAKAAPPGRVIDAGCGAGGNAIAFARCDHRVVAIERDAERLAFARHNAEVYGVSSRIEFVAGDALDWIDRELDGKGLSDALVFVDPPWGVDWDRRGCRLEDFPLVEALRKRRSSFGSLWAKLPPSIAAHEDSSSSPQAFFGEATGDRARIKFVLLRW